MTSRAAKVGLSLTAIAAALLVAEAAVRALHLAPGFAALPLGQVLALPDAELLWMNNPAADEIDSHGLRGPERPAKSKPRLLLLGDSVAFGTGLAPADTIAARMQALFDERGAPFEVLNGGVPGYNTAQEARFLERFGDELQLDRIVLLYCLNDAFPTAEMPENVMRAARRDGGEMEATEVRRLFATMRFSPFERALFERSHLARLLFLRWRTAAMKLGAAEANREQGHLEAVSNLRLVKNGLERMSAFARPRKLRVLVAVVPLFRKPHEAYPESSVHAEVLRLAGSVGFDAIDLQPMLQQFSDSSGRYLGQDGDPVHPNPEGAAKIARLLADRLAK